MVARVVYTVRNHRHAQLVDARADSGPRIRLDDGRCCHCGALLHCAEMDRYVRRCGTGDCRGKLSIS
jgi:hypothetical protein